MIKRIFKWVFGLVLCAVLVVAVTLAWLGRDTAPTHATLQNADLPPLIPVRDFFANTGFEWQ